jgi:hypothetical protein
MTHLTSCREATVPDDEAAAEPLVIVVPHGTHPALIAMQRRLLAKYDPRVTHATPPMEQ